MAAKGNNGKAPKKGSKAYLEQELEKANGQVAQLKDALKATSVMFVQQEGENKPTPVALIGMRGVPTAPQLAYQAQKLAKQDNPWRLDSNVRLKIRTASGTEIDWVNWKIQFNIHSKKYRLITPGHYNGRKYVSTAFMRGDNMQRLLQFLLKLPIQETYPKAEEKKTSTVKPAGPIKPAQTDTKEPSKGAESTSGEPV